MRILILVSDAGSAHRVAGQALERKIKDSEPEAEVEIVEFFRELGIPPFSNSTGTYTTVSDHKVIRWGYNTVFLATNTSLGFRIFKWYALKMLGKAAAKFLEDKAADIVISTHNVTSMVVSATRAKYNHDFNQEFKLDFKFVSCVLELGTVHRSWADNGVDLIVVPTNAARKRLLKYGVETERLTPPLYPLRENLGKFRPKLEVLAALGLAGDTILLTAGGIGAKALTNLGKEILGTTDLNLIFIFGNSTEQRLEFNRWLGQQKQDLQSRARVLGFVENIQDYFNACTGMVIKPGSTSVLEASLYPGQAFLTRPVGIHEVGNLRYAVDELGAIELSGEAREACRQIKEALSGPVTTQGHRRDTSEVGKIWELISRDARTINS